MADLFMNHYGNKTVILLSASKAQGETNSSTDNVDNVYKKKQSITERDLLLVILRKRRDTVVRLG